MKQLPPRNKKALRRKIDYVGAVKDSLSATAEYIGLFWTKSFGQMQLGKRNHLDESHMARLPQPIHA